MMFILVRTNSDCKPQEGISFMLLDMKSPGVSVKPIITLDGGHEVNMVYLENVKHFIKVKRNIRRRTSLFYLLIDTICFGSNASQDEFFQSISEGIHYPGLEHWASLFYPKLESIFDILDDNFSYIFDNSFDDYCEMRFDDIKDYFNTRDIAKEKV